ncbi:MAG TPA: ABC transporter permease [Vicinamibacteria bacterium]|nr:ABC transporter permease [Vicinamibacteria bacterium]HRB11948.1 ABC transporter permease [Vicinamibacteria bacterium]
MNGSSTAKTIPQMSLSATLWESVRTSASEIFAHKLRSTLTLVGIVLGTTSLVVMVSVIGGAAESIKAGFADLGFDGVMFAVPQRPEDRIERKKQGYSRGLRSSDVAVINEGKELIESAAPLAATRDRVRMNGRDFNVSIEGVTPEYGAIRGRGAATGRYFISSDVESNATVAVIGQQIAKDAFGAESPLGREILMRGTRFEIVGVIRSLGNGQVNDQEMQQDNRKIYVPITTLQKQFSGSSAVEAIIFKVPDEAALTHGETEAKALLKRAHRGITDFRVQNIGEEIVRVRKEVDVIIANWTIVLASIAGISLLVGGIGIFSLMQIAISERLFEIGLRKATGATDGAIFLQFLIESVSLSVVGGTMGVILGSGITVLAGQAFEDGLSISPLGLGLSAAFAIIIGLSAGIFPALRASRLTPVEAIRGA